MQIRTRILTPLASIFVSDGLFRGGKKRGWETLCWYLPPTFYSGWWWWWCGWVRGRWYCRSLSSSGNLIETGVLMVFCSLSFFHAHTVRFLSFKFLKNKRWSLSDSCIQQYFFVICFSGKIHVGNKGISLTFLSCCIRRRKRAAEKQKPHVFFPFFF